MPINNLQNRNRENVTLTSVWEICKCQSQGLIQIFVYSSLLPGFRLASCLSLDLIFSSMNNLENWKQIHCIIQGQLVSPSDPFLSNFGQQRKKIASSLLVQGSDKEWGLKSKNQSPGPQARSSQCWCLLLSAAGQQEVQTVRQINRLLGLWRLKERQT